MPVVLVITKDAENVLRAFKRFIWQQVNVREAVGFPIRERGLRRCIRMTANDRTRSHVESSLVSVRSDMR